MWGTAKAESRKPNDPWSSQRASGAHHSQRSQKFNENKTEKNASSSAR